MNASNLIQYIKSCYIALGWSKIIQQDIQGKKEDDTKRNTVIGLPSHFYIYPWYSRYKSKFEILNFNSIYFFCLYVTVVEVHEVV